MSVIEPSFTFLNHYLAPLAPLLDRPDVTDLYINRPQELWIETLNGGVERQSLPSLSATFLDRLAAQVAAFAHQGINREHPILSASLPDGARIQIVIPPATRQYPAFAIRKHLALDKNLASYAEDDAFMLSDRVSDRDHALSDRLDAGDYVGALGLAVHQRRNILISGGTSTGKSTLLNALLLEVPQDERLILIEDTAELKLGHDNAIGLLTSRSALGESLASSDDLLNAALRMRPDRIILGEIRGSEAYTFLRAINSGHPGSMTSIHADSPERAVEQLALLVLQSGTQLRRNDVVSYIKNIIDLYVQLDRINGRRIISSILFSRVNPPNSGHDREN